MVGSISTLGKQKQQNINKNDVMLGETNILLGITNMSTKVAHLPVASKTDENAVSVTISVEIPAVSVVSNSSSETVDAAVASSDVAIMVSIEETIGAVDNVPSVVSNVSGVKIEEKAEVCSSVLTSMVEASGIGIVFNFLE